jgi:hypothetical protein
MLHTEQDHQLIPTIHMHHVERKTSKASSLLKLLKLLNLPQPPSQTGARMHMKYENCFAGVHQAFPKGKSLKSCQTYLNKLSALTELNLRKLLNLNLPSQLQEGSESVSRS